MANILVGGVNLKTLGMHGGYANVKAYGAKADSSYDNYGVVQAIVDGLEANSGGAVLFPATHNEGGYYRFTQGVVNDSTNTVSFLGTGGAVGTQNQSGNQVILRLDSNTDNGFLIKYANTTGALAYGQRIENILFRGASSNGITGSTDGLGANQSGLLFAGRSSGHQILNCGFDFWSGYAVAHDPNAGAAYNQNSVMRNCHFWNNGGCFGPTEEYIAASAYLFNTLYTFDNIGLDSAIGWASWGFTTKPHIFDLRATRTVQSLGVFLIEGACEVNVTSCFAFATDGAYNFDEVWYEITTTDPDYFMAFYGVGGTGQFEGGGQKHVSIRSCNVERNVPFYFEDSASNETRLHIDSLSSYDAEAITEIFEWQNGIATNTSGSVYVDRLEVKAPFKIPNIYHGRVDISMSGNDHQSRIQQRQGNRRLMAWDPSKGSLIQDWGQIAVTMANATTAIEADGPVMCQRFTATSGSVFPGVVFTPRADEYEGASLTILIRFRATIDPGDTGVGRFLQGAGLAHADLFSDAAPYGAPWAIQSGTVYQVFSCTGVMVASGSDATRTLSSTTFGTLTVPAILRIASVEVWLGSPSHYDLATIGVSVVPTFTNADATPSVAGFKTWKTFTAGLTITDLDDFPAGEERTIISKGAIVFDTTGTNLVGSSVDITTASGDITRWVSEDGTTKRLLAFVDVSVDNSAGA